MVFGLGVLEQSPLQAFFSQIRHMDGIERFWVETGVIHGGGNGSWCWIEILDLLRYHPVGFDVEGQFDCILQARAGVARNQIRHQELLLTQLGIDLLIPLFESLVNSRTRLAHRPQGTLADMFRGHFQLSTDMMAADLLQKTGFLIHQDGVKPDPGTDENLFDAIEGTDFFQDA